MTITELTADLWKIDGFASSLERRDGNDIGA
jgi:hypothetical protein